jgi:hypothetical protein
MALPSAYSDSTLTIGAAWVGARSKMSVIREDDSWRIDGDGSGRAVVAYARVENHRLIYDLPEGTASA